jgi:hypothetical protein
MPERRSLLSRMLHSLMQPGLNDSFEILVHQGDCGLGEKVNRMVDHADGSHVVIVDDDDWVAADYVASVVGHDEDSVGYRLVCMVDGRYANTIEHDAAFNEWPAHGWPSQRRRGISQKCPIRRDLAAQVAYTDDYMDDCVWSRTVQQLVGSHTFVDKDLYFYDYRNRDRSRSVGWWPYDKPAIRWL